MQTDDIGGIEQLVERLRFDAAGGGKLFCALGRCPHQHLHAERLCDGCHGARDAAKKDKPQCTALRAVHDVATHRIPDAVAHVAVEERNLAHQVKH